MTHAKAKWDRRFTKTLKLKILNHRQKHLFASLWCYCCLCCKYPLSFMCAFDLCLITEECYQCSKSTNACHWSTTRLQVKFHKEPENGSRDTPEPHSASYSHTVSWAHTHVPTHTQQPPKMVLWRISMRALELEESIFIFGNSRNVCVMSLMSNYPVNQRQKMLESLSFDLCWLWITTAPKLRLCVQCFLSTSHIFSSFTW